MAISFYAMYMGCLRIQVEEDLEENPDIAEKLGSFKKRFINWCANQRYLYEKDLNDEYETFKNKFIDSRLYNTDVKLWKSITSNVFKRDNYTCSYCGAIGGILEADHIVPISKGGTNDLDNLTTSCRTCNRQKKDKSASQFIEWRNSK